MYNHNSQFISGGSFPVAQSVQSNAPIESLTNAVANLATKAAALNDQLAFVRLRVFGEGESSPNRAPSEPSGTPSVAVSVALLNGELDNAHAQVSSILNRL
jgi:hypothetical protein